MEDDDFQVLPQLSQEEEMKLQQEHLDRLSKFYQETKRYAIPSWYHSLKEFTFQSYSFPLTNVQAYLLNLIYQQKQEQLAWKQITEAKEHLVKKVDLFIKQHFPEGCFFKLQTRSPKDFSWRYQNEQSHAQEIKGLIQTLSTKKKQEFNNDLINEFYRYFLEKSKDKIKVTSGLQFVQVFSKSQRIQIDINDLMYLNQRVAKELDSRILNRADEVLLNVWGRKWVDCQWMEEFRCFFNNYQLNAITQYDQRCYFQELKNKEEEIKLNLTQFFQKMVPKLKEIELDSGVMDIIFDFTSEKPTCQLIEVNIFNYNSRGSLFFWEQDEKILKQGPLQVRIHKQPIRISKWELLKMMGMIERGIEKIVNQVMKKLGFQEEWKQYA